MKIKSLKNKKQEILCEAFKQAFKDYEVQLTKDELNTMLSRRGFINLNW